MPVLSLLLLFALLYIITNSKKKIDKYYDLFALSCILRIYWFQGYFLKVGEREIANIAAITEVFLTLYAIYLVYLRIVEIKQTYVYVLLAFIFFNLLGIFLEIVFPYDGLLLPEQEAGSSWDDLIAGKCSMHVYYPTFSDYVKPYLSLVQFGVNVIFFKHVYDKDKFIKSYLKIIRYTKYGVYYGLFEFVVKNVIGNLTLTYDISAMLVGVNEFSCYKEAFMKNGLYTLQGLTREPSHFNCYLFSFLLLAMLGEVVLKNNIKYRELKKYGKSCMFFAVFLLLFSGGFSAVWYLFIIVLSYLVIKNNSSKKRLKIMSKRNAAFLIFTIFTIATLSFIISQNDYFHNRLQDAFVIIDYISEVDNVTAIAVLFSNSEGSGSTIARMFSTYVGLNVFFDRPLFGLGYCLQFVHSFSASFLANMGIIGVISIYKLLTCSNNISKNYDVLLLFIVFIIGGLPITIAPLGLSMHWLLYFEATSLYVNR